MKPAEDVRLIFLAMHLSKRDTKSSQTKNSKVRKRAGAVRMLALMAHKISKTFLYFSIASIHPYSNEIISLEVECTSYLTSFRTI